MTADSVDRQLLAALEQLDTTRLWAQYLRDVESMADGCAEIDAQARHGLLTLPVLLWLQLPTVAPELSDRVDELVPMFVLAADLWRMVHDDGAAAPVFEPAMPPDGPFGRLLQLAAADGCTVTWRTLGHGVAGQCSRADGVTLTVGADAEVLGHELGHWFDPRPFPSTSLVERESFADELGAVLIADRTTVPARARELAGVLVAGRVDDGAVLDRIPVGLQARLLEWFERVDRVVDWERVRGWWQE